MKPKSSSQVSLGVSLDSGSLESHHVDPENVTRVFLITTLTTVAQSCTDRFPSWSLTNDTVN